MPGSIPGALVFDGLDLGGQGAGGQNFELGAQLDLLAELVKQFVLAFEAAGFDVQGHLVDAAGVGDFDLPALVPRSGPRRGTCENGDLCGSPFSF